MNNKIARTVVKVSLSLAVSAMIGQIIMKEKAVQQLINTRWDITPSIEA